ncbi:unnamed protein product [Symbiodinium pilosum]|uniref:Uncharacterized protein n=1 Tax=Symbiodinium pilosum TaxID=2952 RepID=A0A812WVD2_SYMPI|nr:unnamed protein product [Symbiodinium pilosum]
MSAGSCVPLTLASIHDSTAASEERTTKAYTSAWCCFYWAKWATYSLMVGDAVVTAGYFLKAEMYVAMLFSVLGLATTYAILHAQETPGLEIATAAVLEQYLSERLRVQQGYLGQRSFAST